MLIYLNNPLNYDTATMYSLLNSLFPNPHKDINAFTESLKNAGLAYDDGTLYHTKYYRFLEYKKPKYLCHSLSEFKQKISEENLLNIL